MLWTPEKEWDGQDAFLIGGGASLRGFNFSVLTGRNTIGCNDAFRLGGGIVKLGLFGDASWFHKNKFELERSGIQFVCNAPSLMTLNVPWLRLMKRVKEGLHEGSNLGWNFSTGASAINLAISLGARRIFLLGFDCNLTNAKSHWHDLRPANTRAEVFQRFIKGFTTISRELPRYGVEVVHVIDAESLLPFFRKCSLKDFISYLNSKPQETPREVVAA